MDIFTKLLWASTVLILILSFLKDKEKSFKALKQAFRMGKNLLISMLIIVFVIGLILTLVPPNKIADFAGKQSPFLATLVSALAGTVTLVPAIIAFPFVGTLVEAGVSIVPAVAFLTTLTMVGLVTFPLEKREFGLKFTALRNGLSFIFAIIIALLMGVIL